MPAFDNTGVPFAGGLGSSANQGSSNFDWGNFLQSGMMGGALGGIASGLFGIGAENPADAAMPYEQQAMSQLPQYYQPYMDAGKSALSNLMPQYQNMMTNPGGMLNQMGQGFHQSPGFQFALNQALRGANQASAAGGMAGSPQAMQQNMGIATQLGNQDYYNWLNQARGMFGAGLQGEQGLANMGMQASTGLGQNISDILNNMANMQYAGQQQQNQNQGAGMGGLFGGIGTIASMIPFP